MKLRGMNASRFILFFFLVLLFVLAGCSNPQNILSGNAASSTVVDQGHLVYTLSNTSLRAFHSKTGTLAWSQDSPDSSVYQEILVTKTTAYALRDHKLYTFDASSGKSGWSQPIDSLSSASSISNIAVDNWGVYVAANGIAFSFDAKTGNLQWRTTIQAPETAGVTTSLASPKPVIVVQNGVLYTNDDAPVAVVALQSTTGKQLWSAGIPDDTPRTQGGLQAVYNLLWHNGMLYAITNYDIAALNIHQGSILWQKVLGTGSFATGIIIGSFTIEDTTMMLTTTNFDGSQGGAYQLQLSTGTMTPLNLPSGVLDFGDGYHNGVAYMVTGPTSGDLIAAQVSNGTTLWNKEGTGHISYFSVVGENVYIVRDDGVIMLLDGKNGKPLWSKTLQQGQGKNIQTDENAIYSANNGQLLALDVHTGSTLWTASTHGNKTDIQSRLNAPLVFMSSN